MRFCPKCDRVLVRDTSSGEVRFSCTVCGTAVAGDEYDARVGGAALGAGETTAMYRKLIRTASHDRVNQLVRRQCTKCGLDYMTQIRVGEIEAIVYTCKCGEVITGESAFRLADTTDIESILHTAKNTEVKARKAASATKNADASAVAAAAAAK